MSWVNQTHGWKINSIGPEFGISYGVVIHSTTDGGNTWQKKTLSTNQGDFGAEIQFADINHGWCLIFNFTTQVATFLKTSDGGNNWIPFNGAGIFFYVDANNGWSFYGSGQNGSEPPYKILRTTNGGTDWAEQFTDNSAGGYNAMYFSDVNNGWIVGDIGKVLKTTDGGANWNIITNSGVNPAERSKAVFFLDANVGWISSKANDIWQTPILQHTTDGGITWVTLTTPWGSQTGSNAIFSIYFVNEQTGWITGDWGSIARYYGTTDLNEDINSLNQFSLNQNYPNPFNPRTFIQYAIANRQFVTLKVYDILGKEVATLVNEEKPAGSYEVKFDALNYPSGIYFYKLQAGSFIETKKMIFLK
jgi:photosystem II stability/assembly factor-like uncharacterized protein